MAPSAVPEVSPPPDRSLSAHRHRWRRWFGALARWGGAAILLLVLVVALATQVPASRRWIDAALVLHDVQASRGESPLKRLTPPPSRRGIRFAVSGRSHDADFYRPDGGRSDDPAPAGRAGIVLVPGLTRHGRNDAALVAFGSSLARAGFAVLVPDLVNLRHLRVRAADGAAIADAMVHLAGQLGPDRPVGLIAISFAVGPAMLGLLELTDPARRPDGPPTARSPAFMVAVGGYYDSRAMIRFATTGVVTHADGRTSRTTPHPLAKWAFAASNADRVEDRRDAALLAVMAERRLHDHSTPIGDLVAQLGKPGRAVYDLLENRDPDRVDGLIATLPALIRRDIDDLSLVGRPLDRLTGTRFILIHAADDRIIPHAESVRLRRALPAGTADLYEPNGMSHADPGRMTLSDAVDMVRAVHRILTLRDSSTSK